FRPRYVMPAQRASLAGSGERPQQDSNLRTRLRRPMLYPLSYGGSVPWERVPVYGLSPDMQPQSTPPPAGRRYPHGRDARIGTGARRRRRRGDQAADRGEPPAGGLRRGDGGGR